MLSVLREGTADVECIYEPLRESALDVVPLQSGLRMVALPRSHPLADRDFLTPSDLRGETFIPQSDATPKYWQEFWMLVDELGTQPRISSLSVQPSPVKCDSGFDGWLAWWSGGAWAGLER